MAIIARITFIVVETSIFTAVLPRKHYSTRRKANHETQIIAK